MQAKSVARPDTTAKPRGEIDDIDAEVRDGAKDCMTRLVGLLPCTPRYRRRLERRCSRTVDFFFWVVDNFVRLVGPVFVVLVYVLVAGIVYGWYRVLAPFVWQTYGGLAIIPHAMTAHWLLANIIFHYYKGTTVKPGSPPTVDPDIVARAARAGYSYCAHCDNLKPERAHHCQICRTCILSMDHHCPWLNCCVGFHNHRYFFLFMVYMWLGCAYVAMVSYHPFHLRMTARKLRLGGHFLPASQMSTGVLKTHGALLSFCFILTAAVMLALGLLIAWHVYLISTGQTTIDFYHNMRLRSEAKAANIPFVNPYDFGFKRNWRHFLGMENGRGWRHVLLPSAHAPVGDGLHWRTNQPHDITTV